GMPMQAPTWSFPTKDEFADFLESYAARFQLPDRLSTRVGGLTAAPGGSGYLVSTDGGQLHADHVVVATGTFVRTPHVPAFADRLDPSILHTPPRADRRHSQ